MKAITQENNLQDAILTRAYAQAAKVADALLLQFPPIDTDTAETISATDTISKARRLHPDRFAQAQLIATRRLLLNGVKDVQYVARVVQADAEEAGRLMMAARADLNALQETRTVSPARLANAAEISIPEARAAQITVPAVTWNGVPHAVRTRIEQTGDAEFVLKQVVLTAVRELGKGTWVQMGSATGEGEYVNRNHRPKAGDISVQASLPFALTVRVLEQLEVEGELKKYALSLETRDEDGEVVFLHCGWGYNIPAKKRARARAAA